jgi:hypothetical protein
MKYEIGILLDESGAKQGVFYYITSPDPVMDILPVENRNALSGSKLVAGIIGKPEEIKRNGFDRPCLHPDCPKATTMWDHILHHASAAKDSNPEFYKAVGSPVKSMGASLP